MAKLRITIEQYEDDFTEQGYRRDSKAVELLKASFDATPEGCQRAMRIVQLSLIGRVQEEVGRG